MWFFSCGIAGTAWCVDTLAVTETSPGLQPSAPSFPLPPTLELSESWAGNGSKLQIPEGTPPAEVAGVSSLATLAQNWGNQGSLPPVQTSGHRNKKTVARLEEEE